MGGEDDGSELISFLIVQVVLGTEFPKHSSIAGINIAATCEAPSKCLQLPKWNVFPHSFAASGLPQEPPTKRTYSQDLPIHACIVEDTVHEHRITKQGDARLL